MNERCVKCISAKRNLELREKQATNQDTENETPKPVNLKLGIDQLIDKQPMEPKKLEFLQHQVMM